MKHNKQMSLIFFLLIFLFISFLEGKNLQKISFFAHKGNKYAQYDLALFYKQKDQSSKNLLNVFHWFHKSALKGCIEAQYELGLMFHYGIGVGKSKELAQLWFNRSARNGNRRAQIILYRFYAGGKPRMKKENKMLYSQNFRTIR